MYQYIDYYENKKYPTLTAKAYDILEEMIVTMELKPGQIYSENEISTLINIGRTPVREAIKEMEKAHVLTTIPRSGILITPVRLEESMLQLEVRSMLEQLVAVRAAKFALPSEREAMAELAVRYRHSSEQEDALGSLRADNEFNHMSSDFARNPFAKSALLPMQPLARRLYYMQYHVNKELTQAINSSHISVMTAIASGNERLAFTATEDLINGVRLLSVTNMDSTVHYGDFIKKYTE